MSDLLAFADAQEAAAAKPERATVDTWTETRDVARAKACREIAAIAMKGSRPSPALRDSYLAEAEDIEAKLAEIRGRRDQAHAELVRCRNAGVDDSAALADLGASQWELFKTASEAGR